MRLSALAPELIPPGHPAADVEVTALTSDSRAAGPGSLFAGLPGTRVDGASFVPAVAARGAAAALIGTGHDLGDVAIPVIAVDDPRHWLAVLAARFHGAQPSTIVAVTGTSGKTSVAAFVRQIFDFAGRPAASLGTIGIVTARSETYGSLTTPDPITLAELLAGLKRDGYDHVAIEASSHGLDQRRLDGVRIAAAGFTNLSRDHMDYHPTVEHYLAAKLRLFDTLLPPAAPAVIDVDSPEGLRAAEVAAAHGHPVISVGTAGATLRLVANRANGWRQSLTIATPEGEFAVDLPLLGTFQVQNALVAAGLAIAAGVPVATALKALETLKGASGRLEYVGSNAAGAPVFVDYAHKPDALEKALAALKPFAAGRLISVFGCGGDRDPGKRPMMGRISTDGADVSIVTDDNPRSEDAAEIRRQILAAAPGAIEIGDRAEAIRAAIAMAGAGDIVMIAGKGHEPGQIVAERDASGAVIRDATGKPRLVTLPFSDHEAARACLPGTDAP